MPNNLPDYEKLFLRKCKANHSEVVDSVQKNEAGMMMKISTFCRRSGSHFDDVREKILEDKMFAFHFAKDPAKQNLFETAAGNYIRKIKCVSNYKKLPSSGPKATYVVKGGVINGKERKKLVIKTDAKSIDFSWECGDKKFYTLHKYTRQSGGAQDNQYKDIQDFIENANHSHDDKHFFIAIADGTYFNTRNGQANVSKIENLKKISNNNMGVYAVKISELDELLKSICKK